MQQDDQKAELFKPSYIGKPHAKQPVDWVVRFVRTLGTLLIVLSVLLVAVPVLYGWSNSRFFYLAEHFLPVAKQILFLVFAIGVGLSIAAPVLYVVRRRTYVGTLLRWGVAISAASFVTYTVLSLLLTITAKPVIYLYPETTIDVTVRLDYDGTLIADYPLYNPVLGGWRVTAQPDGTLTNHADGREYSYLFWEGTPATPIDWDLSTGFVVRGSDTREFFQDKLAEIGLTPREYNEFIVYWYPKMKDNPYNLIHFAGAQYTDTAPLTITPTPDSTLRVFMVYKPLSKPIDVTPQTFTPFTRTGFTVVEWGGTEV